MSEPADQPTVDRILAESLVLIDPMENPDGRARFVLSTTQARGRWPDAEPASAEHVQPWPGGRSTEPYPTVPRHRQRRTKS